MTHHTVSFTFVPRSSQETLWSHPAKNNFGHWRAECSCGWSTEGSKTLCETMAGSHDLFTTEGRYNDR